MAAAALQLETKSAVTVGRRTRILIAAAAAAAVGKPVRILDIRPVAATPSRWVRKARTILQVRTLPRSRKPAPHVVGPPQPEAQQEEPEL